MACQEICVDLADRAYSIVVGPNASVELAVRLRQLFPSNRHAVVIFDEAVTEIANAVATQVSTAGSAVTSISVPSGEQSKSVEQLERIWLQMLQARTDRGSLVLAVGGGVIGDLAGFAAATFARGLTLVQIPTTLLSQVDSSVGGKTGVNLPGAKNMVGAFWQPSLVLIDTNSLNTLPQREFASGLAEIIKYAVILLPNLFDYLETNATRILRREDEVLNHIIVESCRAKATVIQKDERETSGLRAILNYGHTFAHAIEATLGYGQLLHGEAVAIGMNMAAHLAAQLGRVDHIWVERQKRLIEALELPTRLPTADAELLWQAMQTDKKVEHGKLRFVLPRKLGIVELIAGVSEDQAKAAIAACR